MIDRGTLADETIALSADWRIRPYDGLQWTLERRALQGAGRWKHQASHLKHDVERWLPFAYCRTKTGLETALSRLRCEGIYLDAGLIAALPNHAFDFRTIWTQPAKAKMPLIAALEAEVTPHE
jgi:hypothetical protein